MVVAVVVFEMKKTSRHDWQVRRQKGDEEANKNRTAANKRDDLPLD